MGWVWEGRAGQSASPRHFSAVTLILCLGGGSDAPPRLLTPHGRDVRLCMIVLGFLRSSTLQTLQTFGRARPRWGEWGWIDCVRGVGVGMCWEGGGWGLEREGALPPQESSMRNSTKGFDPCVIRGAKIGFDHARGSEEAREGSREGLRGGGKRAGTTETTDTVV